MQDWSAIACGFGSGFEYTASATVISGNEVRWRIHGFAEFAAEIDDALCYSVSDLFLSNASFDVVVHPVHPQIGRRSNCWRMLCCIGRSPEPFDRRVLVIIFPSYSNQARTSRLSLTFNPSFATRRSNSLALTVTPLSPLYLAEHPIQQ